MIYIIFVITFNETKKKKNTESKVLLYFLKVKFANFSDIIVILIYLNTIKNMN